MIGYPATQIPKPAEDTDFEVKCVALFREVLDDPNVCRIGTSGQAQDGVDIKGFRNRAHDQLVGIQCKVKSGNSKLTEKEVRAEVQAALGFDPPLREYIIVATCKNDTRIQQLAIKLTQELKNSGRQMQIEVWGWDTLQDQIRRYEAAMSAFDPGFSPSLQEFDRKLDTIIEGHEELLKKSDLSTIQQNMEISTQTQVRLSRGLSDRILLEELTRIQKQRGFRLTNAAKELSNLVNRAVSGDLANGSPSIRSEICERAARANASPETRDIALGFRSQAAEIDPSRDLFVVDGLLKEAAGDPDAALRHLKARDDIDARSATFLVLVRLHGADAALQWATSSTLGPADLSAVGTFNFVITTVENKEFDKASAFISQVPDTQFEEIPALQLMRALLGLASVLPYDQKSALFHGLPINPKQLQFAGGPRTDILIKAALTDLEALLPIMLELELGDFESTLSEFILWLRLELPDQHDAARAQLIKELSQRDTTLRRVRLALAYDVDFNKDALSRTLLTRKQLGGWTPDERLAAFLIAFHTDSPAAIVEFFEEHRHDLFAQSDIPPSFLAEVEILSLARVRRTKSAKDKLKLYRDKFLTSDQAQLVEENIAAIEENQETDLHRKRYEESGDLSQLRLLVNNLVFENDAELLAHFAPKLARATSTKEDFAIALKVLYATHHDLEVVDLANDFPHLTNLSQEFRTIKGWSLYRLGLVVEAQEVARDLFQECDDSAVVDLAINTAIETGDWPYLQLVVAHQVQRIETLSASNSMRMAKLALEIDSHYVEELRDDALQKEPDNVELLLSAYMLSMAQGKEDQDPQARAWFQKAVSLSGTDGPVQNLSFREVIGHLSEWRKRTCAFNAALSRAEIPLFVFSRESQRRLLDITLGQINRNIDTRDCRLKFPVFAFSGTKTATALNAPNPVALDITALTTLHYLGLLEKTIDSFAHVFIAPHTLAHVFEERQFIRVQQPSEVTKARRIQELIAGGRFKVIPKSTSALPEIHNEISDDLRELIQAAKDNGGLVVHSAPILKPGSYLEEAADIGGFVQHLTDTHALMAFLLEQGKLDSATKSSAQSYLRRVDKGWPAAQQIDQSTPLYLDALTVDYLDYANLLEPLTDSTQEILIHESVKQRAQDVLQYDNYVDYLLSAIDSIRNVISEGLNTEKIRFTSRSTAERPKKDSEDDALFCYSTLDLLTSLNGIDAVVADDRYLNKESNWVDSNGQRSKSCCTLDVLATLYQLGIVDKGDYWIARHKLRQAGYYAVPVDTEEILHHLHNAQVFGGSIRETPELKALRESLALPLINDAFITGEEIWLKCVRYSIFNSIRRSWVSTTSADIAKARADWLISILPNPMEWCSNTDNDGAWSKAKHETAAQVALYLVLAEANRERRLQYFKWLDSAVIAPLRKQHPKVWDLSLVLLRTYLADLFETDHDES